MHQTSAHWLKHETGRVCMVRLATYRTNQRPAFMAKVDPLYSVTLMVHHVGRPSPDTESIGAATYPTDDAAGDAMTATDILKTEPVQRMLASGWSVMVE